MFKIKEEKMKAKRNDPKDREKGIDRESECRKI